MLQITSLPLKETHSIRFPKVSRQIVSIQQRINATDPYTETNSGILPMAFHHDVYNSLNEKQFGTIRPTD